VPVWMLNLKAEDELLFNSGLGAAHGAAHGGLLLLECGDYGVISSNLS